MECVAPRRRGLFRGFSGHAISARLMSRFKLLGAHAAQMGMTPPAIVVLLDERVEPRLLLQGVGGGRFGRRSS